MPVVRKIDLFYFLFWRQINPQRTELILEASIRASTAEISLKIIVLPAPDTNWKNGFHLKQNCFYLRRLVSPYWIQKHPTPAKDSGLLFQKARDCGNSPLQHSRWRHFHRKSTTGSETMPTLWQITLWSSK